MNLLFLDLVDKLFANMCTADVSGLATKCGALMASDIHKIPLFTVDFLKKLVNCIQPFLFEVYLIPYMSWFNCSILKQLIHLSNNCEALKMVNNFINSLDYKKQITSYPIPKFSQLMIPLDDSQYTLLATKYISSINRLILKDLKDIEKLLIKRLEITEYALHLVAIHFESYCFYWLIPNQIRPLIEHNLTKSQLELWDKGIVWTRILPVSICSDESVLQKDINHLFSVTSKDLMEVCADMCICVCTYICYICM